MLMGFKNGPQHMQRGLVKWLRFLEQWSNVYIDDVSILGNTCYELHPDNHQSFKKLLTQVVQQDPTTWKDLTDHALQLEVFLHRMDIARIYFDPHKSRLGYARAKLLGKIVDAIEVISKPEKTAAVEQFTFPHSLKQLESFVGLILYLGDTIPHAAQLLAPLQALKNLKLKGAPCKGRQRHMYANTMMLEEPTAAQTKAFELCKVAVAQAPRLHHFNSSHYTYIYVDGSKDFGFGAIVMQSPHQIEGYRTPQQCNILWYVSKRLSTAKQNYWPTELEIAALVWIVRQARHILESVEHQVVIFTDHKDIEDLRNAISLKSSNTVRTNLRLVEPQCTSTSTALTFATSPGN